MPLIVANWKMYPATAQEAERLFLAVRNATKRTSGVEVAVCPPLVWLALLQQIAKREGHVSLGAQDVFWERAGPYTGEVSAAMLKHLGCSRVIVGHSERRIHLGESNAMVQKKVIAVLKERLVPIVCVGEHSRSGDWSAFVAKQVEDSLYGVPVSRIQDIVIAYEPVWAIGTGTSDTPEDALSAVIFIRKLLAKRFGLAKARAVRFLYGGSVNSKNVESFVSREGISGALVGHASLDAFEFAAILKIVAGIHHDGVKKSRRGRA